MIYLPNGKFRVNIFIYSFIQRRCIKLTESDSKVKYFFKSYPFECFKQRIIKQYHVSPKY